MLWYIKLLQCTILYSASCLLFAGRRLVLHASDVRILLMLWYVIV